jgi:hypothetical protein
LGFPGTAQLVHGLRNTAKINTFPWLVSPRGTFMFHVLYAAFLQQLTLGFSVHEDSYHTENVTFGLSLRNGEVHTIHKIV